MPFAFPSISVILGFLWRWRFALLIALSVLSIGYYRFLAHYRLTQYNEAVLARGVAEANLKRATDSFAAQISAFKKTMEENRERNEFLQKELARISRQKATGGDGPLAPVLRDTLDGLRLRQDPGRKNPASRRKPDKMQRSSARAGSAHGNPGRCGRLRIKDFTGTGRVRCETCSYSWAFCGELSI